MLSVATAVAALACYSGLLLSFYLDIPSGPAIILAAGAAYLLSLLLGRQGGVFRRLWSRHHLEA